jgi:hypothetical protein
MDAPRDESDGTEDAFTSAAKSFSAPLRLPVRAPPPPPEAAPAAAAAPASPARAADAATTADAAAAAAASPGDAGAGAGGAAARALAASLARPARADAHLLRQITTNQTQAVRALAHRALAEMESWRTQLGAQQIDELFTYFATFVDVAARSARANEKLLAFARAAAAAAATFATSLAAAAGTLAPLATGELLDTPAGADGARGGGAAAAVKAAAAAAAGSPRAAHSAASVAAALADATVGASTASVDFAASVSRTVAGDEEGPLGRRAAPRAERGALDSAAAPAGGLAGLTVWYAGALGELREAGGALNAQLVEASGAAEKAFADFSEVIGAHMSGDPRRIERVRGRCAWLAELRYRRAARALLAVKARYLAAMAALFDRFRRVELARGEAVGALADAYAALLVRAYAKGGGPAPPAVIEATRALATHADLCRVVDREARARIVEVRARLGGGPPVPVAVAAAGAAAAAATAEEALAAAHASPAAARAGAPIRFNLEPLPAVISPFASPLVVRVGLLLRQSAIMKSWTQAIGARWARGGGRARGQITLPLSPLFPPSPRRPHARRAAARFHA